MKLNLGPNDVLEPWLLNGGYMNLIDQTTLLQEADLWRDSPQNDHELPKKGLTILWVDHHKNYTKIHLNNGQFFSKHILNNKLSLTLNIVTNKNQIKHKPFPLISKTILPYIPPFSFALIGSNTAYGPYLLEGSIKSNSPVTQ